MRARLAHVLGPWALAIRGIAVRFSDVNGPRRYGVDIRCAIQVEIPNRPPVVVHGDGAGAIAAFAACCPGSAARCATRSRAPGSTSAPAVPGPPPSPPLAGAPSLIGRREGRSVADLELALVRPEKSSATCSPTPRSPASARRTGAPAAATGAPQHQAPQRAGMTAILEDSLGRPSRKSTRRSANRGKPSQGKERTAVARSVSPSARAGRGRGSR